MLLRFIVYCSSWFVSTETKVVTSIRGSLCEMRTTKQMLAAVNTFYERHDNQDKIMQERPLVTMVGGTKRSMF